MDVGQAMELVREAVLLTALLVSPVLLTALLVGLFMSGLQTITQVQDQAISFVPKLLGVGAALLLAFPWMTELFVAYAQTVLRNIPSTTFGG